MNLTVILLQEHLAGTHGQDVEGLGVRVPLLDDGLPHRHLHGGHALKDGLLGGLGHVLKQQVASSGRLCMACSHSVTGLQPVHACMDGLIGEKLGMR